MKLAVFATLLATASAFSIKADLGKVRRSVKSDKAAQLVDTL